MDFDLPFGPWVQRVTGRWGDYPVTVLENPDGFVLFSVVLEKNGGVALVLSKAFVFKGDCRRALDASDAVFSKKINNEPVWFCLVQSKPLAAEFTEEGMGAALREAYDYLAKASLEGGTPLNEASPSEREAFLGDPASFLALSFTVKPAASNALPLGADSDSKPVYAGERVTVFASRDERERSTLLRLAAESALLEGAPVLVLDECGFSSLSFPEPLKTPSGLVEPARREYALGRDAFIDLTVVPAAFYASECGYPTDAATQIVALGALPASLDELASRLEEGAQQFESLKAARLTRVLQKTLATLSYGPSNDAVKGFGNGTGVAYVELSQADSSLAAYSLLASLEKASANGVRPLVVFNHSGTRLPGALAELLAALPSKGYRLALGLDPETDSAFLGNHARVEASLSGQAFYVSPKGAKTRFTPRKTL
ncbi:MAG: hypothetical protein WC607_01050 [Candidatus Micrarchaeia archaeon]